MNIKAKSESGTFNYDILELIRKEFFVEETEHDVAPRRVFEKTPKIILNLVFQTINYVEII